MYFIPPIAKANIPSGKSTISKDKLVDKYRNRIWELKLACIGVPSYNEQAQKVADYPGIVFMLPENY